MIPLHRPVLGEEELDAVREVFRTGWLGLGEKVSEFEAALAGFLQAPHVVCVNSCTSALYLSMMALGLGEGDEIVMPSLTFVSCVQAAVFVGATVRFCDVDPETLNLSVSDVERLVGPRTRAVLAFHCSGLSCDLDGLLGLCRDRGVRVIEDAAHALGSTYGGKRIGGFGDATCFSFDPIKLITCGEGGAVVVTDEALDRRLRRMRNLGMEKSAWSFHAERGRREHRVCDLGLRTHMSNLNAAIGLAQLRKVDAFIRRRQEICRVYDAALGALEGVRVFPKPFPETVPFNYLVHVPGSGEALMAWLNRQGIESSRPYTPNHLQPVFAAHATGPLPVTERVAPDLVALPLHPGLSDGDVERVLEVVRGFVPNRDRGAWRVPG